MMEKLKRFSYRIMCALLCVMCVCAVLPVNAFAANKTKTVKVGFFAFDGYHMQDENGNRSGYGYEILQRMAGYAGLRYEYIGYDKSWSEIQDMLENGEIDILTSAQKTDERMKRFDFSTNNIGVSTAILTVKSGDNTYHTEDYSNWNGIRIGMIKDNSRNDSLFEFAKENGFTFKPVYFNDTDDMISALKTKGTVNAILTSSLRRISGESIIAQFDSSPFYVMVKKGNNDLLERVNFAISQMDIYETGFRTKMMKTYYPSENASEVRFTEEEEAYIESMKDKTFTLMINPDREPYSYIKDGKLDGSFYYGTLEVMSRSKLNAEFIDVKNRDEYYQHIKDGSVDIRIDAASDYEQAEKDGYWQTDAYMEIPVARLYREGSTSFTTAAILKNSNVDELFTEKLTEQGITVTYYDSVSAAAQAVLNGKQSMAVLPLNTATVAVRDDQTNRLVSERMYGYSIPYAVNVSMNQDPLLYSIISKCIGSLTDQEVTNLSQYYSSDLKKPFSLIGFVYDYPFWFGLIVVAVIAVMLTVYIFIRNSRKRKLALIQVEKERLLNEELQSALRKTEIAVAAKSTFMSMMSHEIRTPLNAVIGYNTIAINDMSEAKTDSERRQADMKVMDCLSKSEIASRHLLTIINDVLDMSAIESGKIKIANERFDFKGLINSLTTVFYTQAKTKGVDLKIVFDTLTEEWFVGDQMRTNQIITNLLSNAIKFTPDGGTVRLKIRQEHTNEQSAEIHFEVTDTGIGMSEDYISHIWTPFEQADASIARRFGGTGLGLSITKNLVELMGGTIDVESEPGQGTTFRVKIVFTRTKQPEQTGNFDFSAVNALVVDDDQSTCDYIRLLLGRFGARSASVTSGAEAINAVKNAQLDGEPFSVCLIDWRMPKMDGLETVRQIRKVAEKDIPIIVITAYDYSEVADKAAEIGVNTFISKPLFQSSLFNLLANMCGKTITELPKKDEKYDFSGIRVLLAEDNKMNMEIAKNILESSGLSVDCALNGKDAVDKFTCSTAGTYKAILMDVQMPVMDGHEATREIRSSEHPDAKTVPIIAMTADAFAEDVAKAIACGMDGHISKPIDIPTLFGTLDRFINKK